MDRFYINSVLLYNSCKEASASGGSLFHLREVLQAEVLDMIKKWKPTMV